MNTVCIIQARMGSTRLPGKVLKQVLGKSILYWDMSRVGKCQTIDTTVIATSALAQDDAIESHCAENGWPVFRGSEDDLLDRYYHCAKQFNAEVVVRITSDCPLIEPAVCDATISYFNETYPKFDYVNNWEAPTFPIGFSTEVFTFAALEQAWRQDTNPDWREHATPYLYKHPEQFSIGCYNSKKDLSHYRVTIDTPEDYELITRIYEHFGHGDFTWEEWMAFLDEHPDLYAINQSIKQKGLKE